MTKPVTHEERQQALKNMMSLTGEERLRDCVAIPKAEYESLLRVRAARDAEIVARDATIAVAVGLARKLAAWRLPAGCVVDEELACQFSNLKSFARAFLAAEVRDKQQRHQL